MPLNFFHVACEIHSIRIFQLFLPHPWNFLVLHFLRYSHKKNFRRRWEKNTFTNPFFIGSLFGQLIFHGHAIRNFVTSFFVPTIQEEAFNADYPLEFLDQIKRLTSCGSFVWYPPAATFPMESNEIRIFVIFQSRLNGCENNLTRLCLFCAKFPAAGTTKGSIFD